MANVKVGDLAIVTDAEIEEVLGMVVEVKECIGECSFKTVGTHLTWMIRLPRKVREVHGFLEDTVMCPDFALRPVSGLPETETTDEQIKEPA